MSSDTDKLLTRSKQDQQEENYILITGCTHGLGKIIAYKLAKRNFTITMACRNKQEAENYAVELKEKTGNNKIHVIHLDLNSLSSIKQCAEEYKALNLPLNILLNNAGIMDFTSKFDVTDYGVEKHFGINYVGHFLLTHLLLEKLSQSSPSIVINTASIDHFWPGLNVLEDMTEDNYGYIRAYSQSKLAMLLFTDEFNRRYAKSYGVRACATHPGVSSTNIFRDFFLLHIPYMQQCIKRLVDCCLPTAKTGIKPTIFIATHKEIWGFNPENEINEEKIEKKKKNKKTEQLKHKEKIDDEEELKNEDEDVDQDPHTVYLGPFGNSVAWRSKKSRDPAIAKLLWKKTMKIYELNIKKL